jgi:hypothetical protein
VRLLALEEADGKALVEAGKLSGPAREGLFLAYAAPDARAVLTRWAQALPEWLKDA